MAGREYFLFFTLRWMVFTFTLILLDNGLNTHCGHHHWLSVAVLCFGSSSPTCCNPDDELFHPTRWKLWLKKMVRSFLPCSFSYDLRCCIIPEYPISSGSDSLFALAPCFDFNHITPIQKNTFFKFLFWILMLGWMKIGKFELTKLDIYTLQYAFEPLPRWDSVWSWQGSWRYHHQLNSPHIVHD